MRRRSPRFRLVLNLEAIQDGSDLAWEADIRVATRAEAAGDVRVVEQGLVRAGIDALQSYLENELGTAPGGDLAEKAGS